MCFLPLRVMKADVCNCKDPSKQICTFHSNVHREVDVTTCGHEKREGKREKIGLERMIHAGGFPGRALSSKWLFSSYLLIGQSWQNPNHIDFTLSWFPLLPTYTRSWGCRWFCIFWEAVSSLENLVLLQVPSLWLYSEGFSIASAISIEK